MLQYKLLCLSPPPLFSFCPCSTAGGRFDRRRPVGNRNYSIFPTGGSVPPLSSSCAKNLQQRRKLHKRLLRWRQRRKPLSFLFFGGKREKKWLLPFRSFSVFSVSTPHCGFTFCCVRKRRSEEKRGREIFLTFFPCFPFLVAGNSPICHVRKKE